MIHSTGLEMKHNEINKEHRQRLRKMWGRHNPQQCKFKDSEGFVCHKKGRIVRKCRNRRKGDGQSKRKEQTPNSGKPQNYLDREVEVEEEQVNNYTLYSLGEQKAEPYVVKVFLNEESVKMEVETGAAMSVIGEDTFKALKKKHPQLKVNETKVRLHTYTGEQAKVTGQIKMSVKYEEQEVVLPVLVIQGKGPKLIGRNWLQEKLNWRNIFQLKKAHMHTNTHRVEELVQKYEHVFRPMFVKYSLNNSANCSVQVTDFSESFFHQWYFCCCFFVLEYH